MRSVVLGLDLNPRHVKHVRVPEEAIWTNSLDLESELDRVTTSRNSSATSKSKKFGSYCNFYHDNSLAITDHYNTWMKVKTCT